MAEPAGIFIEVDIDEKGVKKLLNHKFEEVDFGKKLGYYFSELLYSCDTNPSNVFIFNYNSKTNKCFIAWLLSRFDPSDIALFDAIMPIISSVKNSDTIDYAMVATTYPEVLVAYQITNEKVRKIAADKMPVSVAEHLSNKLWSFSDNNSFPEPKKALNKRNYHYKNFKNYYKKYLLHIEEVEKPGKISIATKDKPYHLFDKFYTYDNKVFQFRSYTNQIIELPKADPLTLRNVSGMLVDKNFIFYDKLTSNSPPKSVDRQNNSKAIWEWAIAASVDGDSFNYVKEKWDTVYWKDKDAVFIIRDHVPTKLKQVDSETFEYLDFCFGKDKTHVYYRDTIIPIDVNNFELNKSGFISDDKHIFHYEHQIQLDPDTFNVLHYKSDVNPFIGPFILEDKNGKYEYKRETELKITKLIE